MSFALQRQLMVARTIANRGITNQAVLEAMNTIPREDFVPAPLRDQAYEDNPLHIGEGQTISQPYIVALMAEQMNLDKSKSIVLDVGSGSGYAAAVFSRLAKEVHSVERIPQLAEYARENLKPYDNVTVYNGDGSVGLPTSPDLKFDAIAVAAASPTIPKELVALLNEGGKIVIPVGDLIPAQVLVVGTLNQGKLDIKQLCGVRFVPLIGEAGFHTSTN
jgi:protein-L-isoaspartate(D-aspartate) O-methyltransferase